MLSDALKCSHMVPDAIVRPQRLSDPSNAYQTLSNPFKSLQILSNVVAPHAFCLCGCVDASFAECCAKLCLARPCTPVSILHANPLRSFEMIPYAVRCPQMLSDEFRCCHMLSYAIDRMPSDAVRCPQVHSYALKCCHMLSYALGCSQVLSDVLRCFQML